MHKKVDLTRVKRKQDGNVPSRRHILGLKIFKNNYWKNLEIIFSKNIFLKFFFEKKYFLSRTMPKNSKRGHSGSFNVFYKPKTSKKCKEVPFDKFRKFSKKSRIVPKKTQRGDPLVSPVLLEASKNLWLSARIEPTLSGWVEDGR